MQITKEEQESYLRKMRFPPALEAAYQLHYYRRSERHLRLMTVLSFILPLVMLTIPVVLQPGHLSQGIGALIVFGLILAPIASISIGITQADWYYRYWKLVTSLSICFVSQIVLLIICFSSSNIADQPENKIRSFALLLSIVASAMNIFVLNCWQLSFRHGAFIALFNMITVFGYLVRLNIGSTISYMTGCLLITAFGMIGNYSLERNMRADYLSSRLLDEERVKSEALLRNILPQAVADRLKATPAAIADSFPEVSVLFADIVDFTPLSARFSATELVDLLNRVFTAFDALAEKHGMEKIKTIGDAYMVVAGLPTACDDHAERSADMALDMQAAITGFAREDGSPLRLRIGINTGPVVAGVIGSKKFIYDLWGDTVNMASRMESQGDAGIVQVMESTRERLQDRYEFALPAIIDVKGRGPTTTYRLLRRLPEPDYAPQDPRPAPRRYRRR